MDRPRPRPRLRCTRRVVELVILLEDRLKFRLGNADAGVPYLDAEPTFAPTAAEQHLAPRGVFHCVGEQVADHLLQQSWIAAYRKAARDHTQDKSLGLSVIGEFIPQPFQQITDREFDHLGMDGAGLDLVYVEQRIQHARHGAQRLVEPRHQVLGFSPSTIFASSPCTRASVCSGWRRSWLAAARNRDFAALATSACCLASPSSSAVRRRSVMSANVITTPSTPLSWVR